MSIAYEAKETVCPISDCTDLIPAPIPIAYEAKETVCPISDCTDLIPAPIPITERLGTYLDESNKNRHLE
jgi:hypothetical protein